MKSNATTERVLGLNKNATSGFESRLNPRSCVVRPLTTAGSAKMSRRVPFLAQAFMAQEDIGCEDTDGV